MPKRILDTNILCAQLQRLRPRETKGATDAAEWAVELIRNKGTNAIVSPVLIEVLAGVRDPHDLVLTEAFLGQFKVVDERRVLPEDWEEAARIAKRIPKYDRGKRLRRVESEARDFGDCLIMAIANRLNYSIITDDKGLQRQSGRTSSGS